MSTATWAQLRARCLPPNLTARREADVFFCRETLRKYFREIAAARGPAAKRAIVRELLSEVSPLEAKYIVKIMTGDLRIGLKESLVEEAIAKAYGRSPAILE